VDQNHPDIDAAVESAAAALRAFGLGDGRASFAGLRLDHSRQVTVIYRVPDPDFDRRVDELAGPFARVDLQDAAHARADLEAARDRVWDLPGSEDITGLSMPIDGSTLKVTLDGNAEAAQAWMDIALPGLVTVEPADARAGGPTRTPALSAAVPPNLSDPACPSNGLVGIG